MVNRDDPRTSLEERAKALFDDSVERVDGRTRSALNQARHAAVEELKQGRRSAVLKLWAPVTAAAAAAVVAVVMLNPAGQEQPLAESGLPFDDLDIVADADDLEMLENLDFYAWLDSADALPSG